MTGLRLDTPPPSPPIDEDDDDEQTCDICDKRPARPMNAKTSPWCANWFFCHYCDEHFVSVETEMRQICEAEGVKPRVLKNAFEK